jgi:hypothetical protein
MIKRKRGQRYGYFVTKKRVVEGLKAAAHYIWGDDEKKLPASTIDYNKIARQHEPVGKGKAARIYPTGDSVLEFFSSMNEAWNAAGFQVETISRRVAFRVITPDVHRKLEYIYQFQDVPRIKRPIDAPTVREYAEQLGVGHHILCQYAAKQGWVKPKDPVWSRTELKLLEKYAHLSPERIQVYMDKAGFHRTVVSIRLMRKRRNAHKGAPYYSATAVAKLLGCDVHKFDREWLIKYPDELKYEMKGTARRADSGQRGDVKLFHIDTLRDFFCNHPEEIDLGKVDKIWFLWLITKGRVKMVAPSERLSLRGEGYRPGAAKEHRSYTKPGRPKRNLKSSAQEMPHV